MFLMSEVPLNRVKREHHEIFQGLSHGEWLKAWPDIGHGSRKCGELIGPRLGATGIFRAHNS